MKNGGGRTSPLPRALEFGLLDGGVCRTPVIIMQHPIEQTAIEHPKHEPNYDAEPQAIPEYTDPSQTQAQKQGTFSAHPLASSSKNSHGSFGSLPSFESGSSSKPEPPQRCPEGLVPSCISALHSFGTCLPPSEREMEVLMESDCQISGVDFDDVFTYQRVKRIMLQPPGRPTEVPDLPPGRGRIIWAYDTSGKSLTYYTHLYSLYDLKTNAEIGKWRITPYKGKRLDNYPWPRYAHHDYNPDNGNNGGCAVM